MKTLRIALAQINPTVGDLSGNVRKIVSYIEMAGKAKADIVAFPELAVTGYPPEDLLLKPQFIEDNMSALDDICAEVKGITAIVGFVDQKDSICNAAAVISDGMVIDVYHKKYLPNYGVFDEYRYFQPGKRFPVYDIGGAGVGVTICEDIWREKGPAKIEALSGAGVIININASPYHTGKLSAREELLSGRAVECGAAIFYVNMVGGQDELVFDGGSIIVDAGGNIIGRGRQFSEELMIADIEVAGKMKGRLQENEKRVRSLLQRGERSDRVKVPVTPVHGKRTALKRKRAVRMTEHEQVYNALVLGVRDYVRKNGFSDTVIGMSGGVDSALVTTIAVDALGHEHVHGLFMPSRYTSSESREDAHALGGNLGIKVLDVPIDGIFTSYLGTLSQHFQGKSPDITEENLQARIRGNLLMAFSNKFGWLVLTTGNKSEMSVGYATLYGDMAGGFAVIKDVPKTLVYELCAWRNKKAGKHLIPERVLWKEPTAELRPDQRDTDTLPPYPVLDPLIKAYVEDDMSYQEMLAMECDVECLQKVIRMIDRSEYKRRQAPPGIKITPRAFGKDRRFPITNRYRSY